MGSTTSALSKASKKLKKTSKESKTGSKGCSEKFLFVDLDKFEYPYTERECRYRDELCEISPTEESEIRSLIEKAQRKEDSVNAAKDKLDRLSGAKGTVSDRRRRKVLIDTDIGTDIDDVLALLTVIEMDHSHVEIVGITTNYHPTLLRAEIARRILDLAAQRDGSRTEWSEIPIIAGNSRVCGTHRSFFHAGNEGDGLGLSETELKELWSVNDDSDAAADFIFDECKKHPSEVTVLSIGIPSNLGRCAHKYGEEWDRVCGHIVIMGGGSWMSSAQSTSLGRYKSIEDEHYWYKSNVTEEVRSDIQRAFPLSLPDSYDCLFQEIWESQHGMSDEAESKQEEWPTVWMFSNHNLSGDTLASCLLFRNIRQTTISVIPHSVTSLHWLKGPSIETLLRLSRVYSSRDSDCDPREYAFERGLGGVLLREWFRRRRGQRGQCLHDPLTLYEAVYPLSDGESGYLTTSFAVESQSSLQYIRGTFECLEWAAYLVFVPDENGPHRLAVRSKDPSTLVSWVEHKLLGGVPLDQRCEDAGPLSDLCD